MSSTSSSDCENCDCSQCTYLLDDSHNTYSYSQYGKPMKSSRHVPVYTTMAHPLIYYAEVRPLNRRQANDQPRKENRNCFVKAFKWYTQERVNKNDVAPERSGFANWLDYKYVEYLRESRQHQCYELRAQETATIEPCAPCSSPYEPCTTRRFARIRSPWRKRRRPCNDSGDVPEKCPNQSCEFIMQPKDLTRAASDNCYHTPTSGCIKSNATVVSSNMPGNLRCSGRSHSLSSVCRERSVPQHIDTIPHIVQEVPKTQEPAKPCCVCRQEQIQQVPSKPKAKPVDVSCQCPEEQVIPVNVETQYEPARPEMSCYTETVAPCYCIVDTEDITMPMPVKIQRRRISNPEITLIPSQNYTPKKQKKAKQSSVSCQCPEEDIVKVDTQCQYQPDPCLCRKVSAPCRDPKEVNQVFGPKPIRRQSYSTVAINEETCECIVKEVATVCKCARSLTCVANDAVQTSDHAICFDKGGAYPYPLFLKIVCADKLNKECF